MRLDPGALLAAMEQIAEFPCFTALYGKPYLGPCRCVTCLARATLAERTLPSVTPDDWLPDESWRPKDDCRG